MPNPKNKLLICIVAYDAQEHLESVLEKIPNEILEQYNYEILIIDDSSNDDTFATASSYIAKKQKLNIRILHNHIRLGYGKTQKLGFEYAIQNNFETVVLLHGGGQYDSVVMNSLIQPIIEGKADAIIGSRTKEGKNKAKRPFYKYLGNKFFTSFQSKMLHWEFSDFHSGYRAYSVKALKDIPFETNSDNYLFDTQIIIQLLLSKKNIQEIDIPSYSGNEIYLINGIIYGLAGIKATIASKFHKLSIFYRREYDLTKHYEDYSIKLGYLSSHSKAIERTSAKSYVLDVGGGQGRVAAQLKKKDCFVDGIDRHPLKRTKNYDTFFKQDLDQLIIDFNIKKYDTILMLDIIEHLSSPEDFLDKLRIAFGLSQPKVIITTPNIAFFIIRLQLLFGKFNYGKEGILDKTHKRLFTFRTLKKLCLQCGYVIKTTSGIPAPFPKALGKNFVSKALISINQMLIFISKSLFSYQIFMEIEPTPVVSALLQKTIVKSEEKSRLLSTASQN